MATSYRQQTSAGLLAPTACPSCGVAPSYDSYEVVLCDDNSTTLYVDEQIAFDGFNQIINPDSYAINQVLFATAGPSDPRFCVKIVGVEVDEPPTHYFEVAVGPWAQCTECVSP